VDAEVCQPIASPVPEVGAVKVYDLPGGLMACTVHHGPYHTLSQAYNELMPWIGANGYRIVGPDREIYLQTSSDGNQNDPNCVTEIQVPVEKA
jgi:effector-binding domain-containing protein